jgi:hypothetical protein
MARARGQVQEYEGLFKGVGVTSKEPVFGKKGNSVGELHKATHFAVGCQKWDDHAVRGKPRSHAEHAHPEVTYGTCDAPENNISQIELGHQEHSGAAHYRTEHRVRYDHLGPQPREQPFNYQGSVCLGSDQQLLQSQKKAVHARIEDGELQRSAAMRAAGQGALVPTSQWPKPPRCHVLHGGPRSVDSYDLGVMDGGKHGRITGNYSNVVYEANTRDPILGYHVPLAAQAPSTGMRTTSDLIAEANEQVPPLRSLMAVRPRV